MYDYIIVDTSKEKKNQITKGKATFLELKEIIPSDIIELVKTTNEIEIQMGNEVYIIKKIG